MRIAEEIGLDVEKLRADMAAPEVDEHIATSRRLTQALGFKNILFAHGISLPCPK